MDTPKHTPLPWTVEHRKGRNSDGTYPEVVGFRVSGGRYSEHRERVDADAEYIVRVCNAFPKLVEALEVALTLIPTARKHFPRAIKNGDRFDLENANATITKALRQAKGEV